jgi:RNA polymerase sigma factor (sigma-70 family)
MKQASYIDAEDGELLLLCGRDPQAFGVFYDRFERAVLTFFLRATGRAEVAADLTAETFVAALSSAGAFKPELGSARAWLFGIARHELADAWERGRVEDRARKRLGLEPLVLSDESLERIEEIAASQSIDPLALLDRLPPDQRLAVEGRVIDGSEYRELALRLCCSESVVRKRVSRGLQSLRGRLEQTP